MAKSVGPKKSPSRPAATAHAEPSRGGEGSVLEEAGARAGGSERPGRSKACAWAAESTSHLRGSTPTCFTASVGAPRRPATGALGVLRVGPLPRLNRAQPHWSASTPVDAQNVPHPKMPRNVRVPSHLVEARGRPWRAWFADHEGACFSYSRGLFPWLLRGSCALMRGRGRIENVSIRYPVFSRRSAHVDETTMRKHN